MGGLFQSSLFFDKTNRRRMSRVSLSTEAKAEVKNEPAKNEPSELVYESEADVKNKKNRNS